MSDQQMALMIPIILAFIMPIVCIVAIWFDGKRTARAALRDQE